MALSAALEALLACLFACAVGSTVAALVARSPAERAGWLIERSHCPHCKSPLRVSELVPLISWLLQLGRCRRCGAAISISYPVIEAAALLIALVSFRLQPPPLAWSTAGLGWWLLALSAMDLREQRLPDLLTLPLLGAGLLVAWAQPDWAGAPPLAASLLGALLAGGGLGAVRWAYSRLRRREGLGLGDVKLAAALGAWLGPWPLPSVLLLASAFGLVHALAVGARREPSMRVPFGPSLAIAFWLVWLTGSSR